MPHKKTPAINDRLYFWDNMKGILIILVVIAHMGAPCDADKPINILNEYIFLFHMPMFIFIAGLFTKAGKHSPGDPAGTNWAKRAVFYFVLFFTVHTLLFVEMHLFKADWVWAPLTSGGNYSEGGSATWFLLAMFWYALLTPLCREVKPVVIIAMGIFLALISGYYPVRDFLAASRTIVFFPFFCMGLYLDPKRILNVWLERTPLFRVIARASAVAVLVMVWLTLWRMSEESLLVIKQLCKARTEYDAILNATNADYTISQMMLLRCVCYIVAIGLFVMLFVLCPQKKIPFLSKIGKNSIVVYIYHCYIFYPLLDSGLLSAWMQAVPESIRIIMPLLLGIGISVALGMMDFLNKPIDLLRNLVWQNCFRRQDL